MIPRSSSACDSQSRSSSLKAKRRLKQKNEVLSPLENRSLPLPDVGLAFLSLGKSLTFETAGFQTFIRHLLHYDVIYHIRETECAQYVTTLYCGTMQKYGRKTEEHKGHNEIIEN